MGDDRNDILQSSDKRCVEYTHFLSREHLTLEHTHITRTVKETIIYLITGGRLDLETDYGELNLVPGDIHVFRKGEFQKPLSFGECEYYYFHLHDDFEETELSEEELKKIIIHLRIIFEAAINMRQRRFAANIKNAYSQAFQYNIIAL